MEQQTPRIHNEIYPFIYPSKFKGSLQDKVTLLTGSAGAIGQAHAECFAVAGANLVLTYNRTPPPGTLKEKCMSLGASKVTFIKCDVGSLESIEALVKQVLEAEGRVDILINNAGANGLESFHKQDPRGFLQDMAVNFNGPYALMRFLLPGFRDQKSGCVINIASKAGTVQGPFMASYCASKAALINLTGCVQVECNIEKFDDIHVYSIHPGGVRSVMTESKYSEKNISQLPAFAQRFRNHTSTYNDSPHLSGMTSVALATGLAKDALKGKYYDVTQDLEDVISQADAIKKDPLLYGLGTKFLGELLNHHVVTQDLEKPFEFPGF